MSNIEITNNVTRGIVILNPVFQNETLTSAGAVVWAAGTLLGRVTASGKLTAYVAGASDGSEIPVAVTTQEIEFTGAGDQPDRPLIGGQVRRGDLVAHGVGAITVAEADALRDFGIVSLTTTQLSQLDNQ